MPVPPPTEHLTSSKAPEDDRSGNPRTNNDIVVLPGAIMCRFRLNPEKVVPLIPDHLLMIGRWSGLEKLGHQPHLGDHRQLPGVPRLSSGRYPEPVNGITPEPGACCSRSRRQPVGTPASPRPNHPTGRACCPAPPTPRTACQEAVGCRRAQASRPNPSAADCRLLLPALSRPEPRYGSSPATAWSGYLHGDGA